MKWLFVFCLAGLIGVVVVTSGQAADPACKLYKVNEPILYVHKNAEKSGEYIGVLESGILACITREQYAGGGQWGYVAHIQQEGSLDKPVNGWVGLQFMVLQSNAAALPAPAVPAPAQFAAPSQTTAALAHKEAESVYRSTVAIGSCGAYKLFNEEYGGSVYGPLAQQYLQINCTNRDTQIKSGAAPVAAEPARTAPVAVTGAEQKLSAGELIVSIQQELGRLGCNPGSADGDWGRRTRSAMSQFNRYTNFSLDTQKPTKAALPVLRSINGTICPPPAKAAVTKAKKAYPKKKPVTSAKKKPYSGSAKKKEQWGGEQTRVDCQRAVTADCF